jgi:hypothetical protein
VTISCPVCFDLQNNVRECQPFRLDALDIVIVAAGYANFRATFTLQEGAALLSTRATVGCCTSLIQLTHSLKAPGFNP